MQSPQPQYIPVQIAPQPIQVQPEASTPPTQKAKFNPRLQLLVENEIIGDDDPAVLRHLVRAFNFLYRLGFFTFYYLLLILTIIVAPFLGCAIGALEIIVQLLRGFTRPLGKLVADAGGYGQYLSTRTEYMERKMYEMTKQV